MEMARNIVEYKRSREKKRRKTDPCIQDKQLIPLDLILQNKKTDIELLMSTEVPSTPVIPSTTSNNVDTETRKERKKNSVDLITLALIEKINFMELQNKKIKRDADAQVSFVSQQLFHLEGKLRKEQLRISQLLQDKDNIIVAQKQEILKLRQTVYNTELATVQKVYGSLRRSKRERASQILYSSSTDDSSSPGSSPKQHQLSKHHQLSRKLSDDPRILQEISGAGGAVNLTRQTKLISRGTERPKLKQSASVGNLISLEQEENQFSTLKGILKTTCAALKKPPIPSRQGVNEKLKLQNPSDDSGRESDLRESPGRTPRSSAGLEDLHVFGGSPGSGRTVSAGTRDYIRDSGNSSMDFSDTSLEFRLSPRSVLTSNNLQHCFEQYIIPTDSLAKQTKRVSFVSEPSLLQLGEDGQLLEADQEVTEDTEEDSKPNQTTESNQNSTKPANPTLSPKLSVIGSKSSGNPNLEQKCANNKLKSPSGPTTTTTASPKLSTVSKMKSTSIGSPTLNAGSKAFMGKLLPCTIPTVPGRESTAPLPNRNQAREETSSSLDPTSPSLSYRGDDQQLGSRSWQSEEQSFSSLPPIYAVPVKKKSIPTSAVKQGLTSSSLTSVTDSSPSGHADASLTSRFKAVISEITHRGSNKRGSSPCKKPVIQRSQQSLESESCSLEPSLSPKSPTVETPKIITKSSIGSPRLVSNTPIGHPKILGQTNLGSPKTAIASPKSAVASPKSAVASPKSAYPTPEAGSPRISGLSAPQLCKSLSLESSPILSKLLAGQSNNILIKSGTNSLIVNQSSLHEEKFI